MTFLRGLLIGCILSVTMIIEAAPTKRQSGDHQKENGCVPAFLVNAPQEVRQQFQDIEDQSLNRTAKEAAYDALAAKQDPAIQAAYQQFKTVFLTKYDALSNDTKSALEAFGAIEMNTALSQAQRKAQEESKWGELTNAVRNEIVGLIQLQGDCGGLEDD